MFPLQNGRRLPLRSVRSLSFSHNNLAQQLSTHTLSSLIEDFHTHTDTVFAHTTKVYNAHTHIEIQNVSLVPTNRVIT